MEFLEEIYLGQSVRTWLIAAGIGCGTWLGVFVLTRIVAARLGRLAARSTTYLDDAVVEALRRTNMVLILVIAVWAATRALELGPRPALFVNGAAVLASLLQLALWGNRIVAYSLERFRVLNLEADAGSVTTMGALAFVARIAIWSVLVLVALDNLGVDVTALVAGLGIGGIAVALALQNVLGDLFASLSIALDKPFVIGDFLVIGEFRGNVERIGLKTTRLRSLSGEQLIFSNADLLSSRIRNYQRMSERRAEFVLGVVYQTPADKLQRIPAMLREVIEGADNTRFDRAHFKAFGDFSLNFEVVYYVNNRDYSLYMDVQQVINLEIFRRFEAEEIEFAYPTRTLHLNPSESFERALQGGSRPDAADEGRKDNGASQQRS
ncbi:MAG TPA: mechanosensitive ion channel domain-containing protein [Kofleriaceae bacterium]|nr:mechanosensitive ion channel domain-containing protein [Kofleriaceae bacterium]